MKKFLLRLVMATSFTVGGMVMVQAPNATLGFIFGFMFYILGYGFLMMYETEVLNDLYKSLKKRWVRKH
jgi:hypothetical protein